MLSRLLSFAILALLALASTWLVEQLHIPVPPPVIGLIVLFLALLKLGRVPLSLAWVSRLLLHYLALFFVPATVAVVLFKEQIIEHGLILFFALISSTLISLFVAAWIGQKVLPVEDHDN